MCLPAAVACLCAAVCGILESSAGVGVGDDRGAQSEQGGQEMGNQGGQRAQEYHSLQASKRDTHTYRHAHKHLLHVLEMQHVNLNQVHFKVHAHSCSNHALCLCVLLSVSGGV